MTSQITPAQADTLLAGLVLSADLTDWSGLIEADKQVLLNRAQAMIDAGAWNGTPYDDDQAYAFPRTDDDGELIGVENEPDDPLPPVAVQEALALLAFSFVHRADIWERRQAIASGLASQGTAGLSEAYVAAGGPSQVKGDLSAVPQVWSRLGRFWRVGGRII